MVSFPACNESGDQRMFRTFAALGAGLLLMGHFPASADKLRDQHVAARAEINPLGDKALTGDTAALAELEEIAKSCKDNRFSCGDYAPQTARAATAAANLGWLYWEKELLGPEKKLVGMRRYAEAAKLGSAASLYQVGQCLRTACVPLNQQSLVFGDIFPDWKDVPWTKDRYGQLKAASMILQHSLNAGLTEAAIAKAEVDYDLFSRVPEQGFTQDEWTLASYAHLSGVVGAAKKGLETNPTEAQKKKLEGFRDGAAPQLANLEADAAAARARKAGAGTPVTAPPVATAPATPNKGADYEADKSRALACVAESDDIEAWRRDLGDWSRDLAAWDKELQEDSITLQLSGGGSASAVAAHNRNVDAFNAEGRDYDAEQREYNQAADAYNARCKGSFNRAAIDEVCTGNAGTSRFCKGFR